MSPTSIPAKAIRARASHRLATAQRGLNVQRFLVGRQFFVVFVVFLAAQLTTYPGLPKDSMPKWLYIAIINTGLPGALVVLAFGQLMPQLIAATHPITMMNLVGSYQVIQLALGFEFIGITHFSWLLASVVKRCSGLDDDAAGSRVVDGSSEHHHGGSSSSSSSGSGSGSGSAGNGGSSVMTGNPNDSDLQHQSTFTNPSWLASTEIRSSESPLKPLLDSWSNIRSRMDLDVGTLDASQLYEGAERGLEPSTTSDIRSREMMAWLQTQSMSGSRNLASLYESRTAETKTANSKVNSTTSSLESDDFPSPADITRFLIQSSRPVPRYLLPPHHEKHIPPHIVAFDLVRRHDVVTERLFEYQSNHAKVARSMRVLEKIYQDLPAGTFPELDALMQDRAEAGELVSDLSQETSVEKEETNSTEEKTTKISADAADSADTPAISDAPLTTAAQ